MKKIVALVLSLVMVLGLATVAFGAVEYSKTNVDADGWIVTDFDTETVYELDDEADVEKVVYADYTETVNGKTTKYYGMTFYVFNDYSTAAVVCAKDIANMQIEDGAKIIYVYAFPASVMGDYGYTKVVATDFVKGVIGTPECGETSESYYVVGDKKVLPYDGGSVNPIVAMYKNEVVLLEAELDATTGDPVMVEATLVPHAFITAPETCKWSAKDNELVSVTCACGDIFKVVQDIKGMKAGSYVSLDDGNYVVLAATPAADAETTDKVESAETFDAGIAMYVGMSVMAAAGSAVVLKKKD